MNLHDRSWWKNHHLVGFSFPKIHMKKTIEHAMPCIFCLPLLLEQCHKWSMEFFMNKLSHHSTRTYQVTSTISCQSRDNYLKRGSTKTCPQNKHPRKITEHHQVLPLVFFESLVWASPQKQRQATPLKLIWHLKVDPLQKRDSYWRNPSILGV